MRPFPRHTIEPTLRKDQVLAGNGPGGKPVYVKTQTPPTNPST